MRTAVALLLTTAVGAGAIGAAVKLNPTTDSITIGEDHDWERGRPGPDSGRVAILLDALGRTDPIVCELIGDQLGNFWWGGEHEGVGRLAAAPVNVQLAKDSIGGTITDPRAINRLVAELDGQVGQGHRPQHRVGALLDEHLGGHAHSPCQADSSWCSTV